jgi:beta-N-acetylhexosaminidase
MHSTPPHSAENSWPNQEEQIAFPGEAQPHSNGSSPDHTHPEWLAERLAYLSRGTLSSIDTQMLPSVRPDSSTHEAPTALLPAITDPIPAKTEDAELVDKPTTPLPIIFEPLGNTPPAQMVVMPERKAGRISRRKALGLMALLSIPLTHALGTGATQFISNQGWAYVLGGPAQNTTDPNLLTNLNKQITPQATTAQQQPLTPEQYVTLVVQNMTLDQKLGQMMLVQFEGAQYSLNLSSMVSKYNVGAVILFASNNNIVNSTQLKTLVQQMQDNSHPIPLAISMDQEGGYVNRLYNLVGQRPAAATIGASKDLQKAYNAGVQDATDLQKFGINVNLAPVVDVDNAPSSELHKDLRTFGQTPEVVISMAGAYLQGLQKNGKVIGTLKHFPGLGSITTDPHFGVPHLKRSMADMERIDWAPYAKLIEQKLAHAVMVTHEIVDVIDPDKPASISAKVVQGILRDKLGFKGVVMTDSLTMSGVTDFYTPAQAAVLSVIAGADLLMGAKNPTEVGAMFEGIKKAMNDGEISQQRIDDSVHRILLMKHTMGLIKIPRS